MPNPFQGAVAPYIGQTYPSGTITLDDNLQTEAQKITIKRMDGGARVETLARGWAGRVEGAPFTELTITGVIPNAPSDVAGVGFSNNGMTTGGGFQMDATMLTSL